MKTIQQLSIGLLVYLYLLSNYADGLKEEYILSIDKPIISHENLFFPNQDEVQPDKSDIQIISYILLSSKSGERWATVTFENLSKGQRILTKRNILAILANGKKKSPLNLKQKFAGNEKITLNLNFGINKFPILSLYARN